MTSARLTLVKLQAAVAILGASAAGPVETISVDDLRKVKQKFVEQDRKIIDALHEASVGAPTKGPSARRRFPVRK